MLNWNQFRKATSILLAFLLVFSSIAPSLAEAINPDATTVTADPSSTPPPTDPPASSALLVDPSASPDPASPNPGTMPPATDTPVPSPDASVTPASSATPLPDASVTPENTATPLPDASLTPASSATPSPDASATLDTPTPAAEATATPAIQSLVGVRLPSSSFAMMSTMIAAGDLPGLYTVTINYVDSSVPPVKVAEPYLAVLNVNDSGITVTSPTIQGYSTATASVTVVPNSNGFTATVVYAPSAVSYKVEHYLKNLDGTFPATPDRTTNMTGAWGNLTQARAESIPGFVEYPITQKVIAQDGTTVVRVEYWRVSYSISYNTGLDGTPASAITRVYGTPLTTADLPANPQRLGYGFAGWDWNNDGVYNPATDIMPATMPAYSISVNAIWTPNPNTPFRVIYHVQNANDNNYTEFAMISGVSGSTGTLTQAGYLAASGTYAYSNATRPSGSGVPSITWADLQTYFHTNRIVQVVIKGDGTSVANVYYDRNTYTFRMYTDVYKRNAWSAYYYDANVVGTDN